MYALTDYDYYLPEALIAQEQAVPRDHSRLMVYHRKNGIVEHRRFFEILEFFRKGDVLIVNDTRVIPARITGTRASGGKAEIFLLKKLKSGLSGEVWEALVRPGKKMREGAEFTASGGQKIIVQDILPDGLRTVLVENPSENWIQRNGSVPLPPYIHSDRDAALYQTIFAQKEGAVAAPTAGLHFTNQLLLKISEMGITVCPVTLHVGIGTFREVTSADIRDHQMHEEYYEITEKTAETVNHARKTGGRIIACGTTSLRTLESSFSDGKLNSGSGDTGIFIYPGYKFQCTDVLLTNFHLPRSSLLMLVSAMMGRQNLLSCYQEAVRCSYRFFSFGDAMMVI